MADIYNAQSDETAINNGSVIVKIPGRLTQVNEDRAYHLPTIETISGQYDSRWTGVRFYTGDEDS